MAWGRRGACGAGGGEWSRPGVRGNLELLPVSRWLWAGPAAVRSTPGPYFCLRTGSAEGPVQGLAGSLGRSSWALKGKGGRRRFQRGGELGGTGRR